MEGKGWEWVMDGAALLGVDVGWEEGQVLSV